MPSIEAEGLEMHLVNSLMGWAICSDQDTPPLTVLRTCGPWTLLRSEKKDKLKQASPLLFAFSLIIVPSCLHRNQIDLVPHARVGGSQQERGDLVPQSPEKVLQSTHAQTPRFTSPDSHRLSVGWEVSLAFQLTHYP